MKKINWSFASGNKITFLRKLLSHFSIKVREKQYVIFLKKVRPNKEMRILDVGVTPNEILIDSNFFEQIYPYKTKLTTISVEECPNITKKYPGVRFKKIRPYSKFPFPNKYFDIVVSWATLEHAGSRKQQKLFLSEIVRVGKRVFITTPNRSFPFEFHSTLFLVHWLPHKYFRIVCRCLGMGFWGERKNLNLLNRRDLNKIIPSKEDINLLNSRSLGIFTSHLIIVRTQ